MIVTNFTDFKNHFKNHFKKFLDNVEENDETLIIKSKSGKGTVMISLVEYFTYRNSSFIKIESKF